MQVHDTLMILVMVDLIILVWVDDVWWVIEVKEYGMDLYF